MKKLEKITFNINSNKELLKAIEKNKYYTIDNFINDSLSYIKAIKEGRMINNIGSVSNSGMSRTIHFLSCQKSKSKNSFYYRNYFSLFLALGYCPKNDRSHYFRIHGCGMDMIFNTNYNIIHKLTRLGFLSKKDCEILAQKTPSTI